MSVLVPDQCIALATNTEAYCSCNSTLHMYATYDKIHTTCTNKKQSQTVPFLIAGQIIL